MGAAPRWQEPEGHALQVAALKRQKFPDGVAVRLNSHASSEGKRHGRSLDSGAGADRSCDAPTISLKIPRVGERYRFLRSFAEAPRLFYSGAMRTMTIQDLAANGQATFSTPLQAEWNVDARTTATTVDPRPIPTPDGLLSEPSSLGLGLAGVATLVAYRAAQAWTAAVAPAVRSMRPAAPQKPATKGRRRAA
jgi:hypothetical protein